MKTDHAETKTEKQGKPFGVVKIGNVSVPIYRHTNIIPQRDAAGEIIRGPADETGKRRALIKYQSDIYTLAYHEGSKRVRQKFSDLEKARREAELVAVNIGNGELEALKLKGHDRADYVRAMQRLRDWRPDADLNSSIKDYVTAVKRLPENTSLAEAVDYFTKRHPIGLPPKTVREVVNELIASKTSAGKSDVYIKDLNLRLGAFADSFQIRISSLNGKQIEEYIRGLKTHGSEEGKRRPLSGRTQNNIRRLISTLFKFAIKRG